MGRDGYLIGELAQRSGLSRRALRLYEARGILPSPRRTPSGYRVYGREVLDILTFVTEGRRLGLTLSEIRHIVVLRRACSPPCVHVRQLLEDKVQTLEAVLSSVRSVLKSWNSVRGRQAAVCPHIERKGGDVEWTRVPFRSARPATIARKSSSKVTASASARTPTPPSSRRTNGTSSWT
jgi:MerR family copper efflux transcriptional regulator